MEDIASLWIQVDIMDSDDISHMRDCPSKDA